MLAPSWRSLGLLPAHPPSTRRDPRAAPAPAAQAALRDAIQTTSAGAGRRAFGPQGGGGGGAAARGYEAWGELGAIP